MVILVVVSVAALLGFGVLMAGMRAAAQSDERLGLDFPREGGSLRPANLPAEQPAQQRNRAAS